MKRNNIISSIPRLLTVLTGAIMLLASPALWAQPTSDSPLLNGLERIMRDPEKKLAVTPDKTVVFVSKAGEASFGADSKMRLHAPGTLKRMMDISKGFDVKLGEALGHRGNGDSSMSRNLLALVKDPGLNFRLRPNQMGFGGKSYSSSTRPMDLWSSKGKMTICPGGVCKIKQSQRSATIGFGTQAKPVVSKPTNTSTKQTSRPRVMRRVSAVSTRRVKSTSTFRARAQITSQSNFKPMAINRMRLK